MSDKSINRRAFLATTAASTAAATIIPRNVLGGKGFVPPSDRVNIGYVGNGTQGIRQLIDALKNPDVHIRSVCDPNRESSDYIPWFQNEVRNKIRQFLKESNWDEGVQGCRCGREVGKAIVEKHYSRIFGSSQYKGCSAYSDFRELLEEESDLDAIYIMTPDHLHATVALAAMKKGKHAITHKPISNIYYETRLAIETAKKTGLATHMFCSADQQSTPRIREWIDSGIIGPVREVHCWSSRPFWPQGMAEYPAGKVPVPDGLQWDLWLGPVPDMPYHPSLTHAVFRGWYEFGAGALGDMGHYAFYQIFKIMEFGYPTTVEASRSQYWAIIDHLWKKQDNHVAYPRSSMIHWEFGARGNMPAASLHWYDGGLRPQMLKELEEDGKPMPDEGMLFVGDEGKILCGFMGQGPRLVPKRKMDLFKEPPERLPRPAGELEQWLGACKGDDPSGANFVDIAPFAETICLGNIALRVNKKLEWDAGNRCFANSAEADKLLKRKAYRSGWEL
jgi:predicted dehydrogenase